MTSRLDPNRRGKMAVVVRSPQREADAAPLTPRAPRRAGHAAATGGGAGLTAMDLYLSELGHTRLLRPGEEMALAQRVARGDAEARRIMAEANLRLVVHIASHYHSCGLPLEDLIAEGNMGLLHAVEKYEWQRGFRFSTYAVWWIRQAITRFIANHRHTVHVPIHLGEALARHARAVDDLAIALGRQPRADEIAAIPGPDKIHADAAARAAQVPLPLEMAVGENGVDRLADVLLDDSTPLPEDEVVKTMTREETSRVLREVLTDRERRVIGLRYGFDDREPQSLDTIGRQLGITRERVRQIEVAALGKLRQPAVVTRLGAAVPRCIA